MAYCSICSELSGESLDRVSAKYSELAKKGSTILTKTESFRIIPSVGALNSSHAMVVPRQHVNSLADLCDRELRELSDICARVREFGSDYHQWRMIFFEHGSGRETDLSGACVDHAHLHILDAQQNLISTVKSAASFVELPTIESVREVADREFGYILVVDQESKVWIANRPNWPSQYFRYLYAENLDSGRSWNWRSDPAIDAVSKVIESYKGLPDWLGLSD